MPQMNGGKLVELLQEKQPGIGVLYTSGYTGDAMVARGVLTPGSRIPPEAVHAFAARREDARGDRGILERRKLISSSQSAA